MNEENKIYIVKVPSTKLEDLQRLRGDLLNFLYDKDDWGVERGYILECIDALIEEWEKDVSS